MSTYYYSLIKCTPDMKRQETINIGVVVFHNARLDVRLLQSASKLQLFATDAINDALNDIEERYNFFSKHADTPEEKHSALSMFNDGMIRLGGLGFFMATTNTAYESVLRRLLTTLVEPQKIGKSTHKPQFSTKLKTEFEKLNLLGNSDEDIAKHKVIANFMLDETADIKAEFMLKNGVYHLTETVDFNTQQSLPDKRRQTTDKLWTYSHAEKVLKDSVERYFVYSASVKNESRARPLIDLVIGNNTHIFNWESMDDRKQYIDTIQKHATFNRNVQLQ